MSLRLKQFLLLMLVVVTATACGGSGSSPSPTDTDNDGIADSIDTDDDNDGILDVNDADPLDPNVGAVVEPTDTDGDNIPDSADADDDGDGVPDTSDPAPLDPTITSTVTTSCPYFATDGTNADECILPTAVTEDISLSSDFTWLLNATMVVGEGNIELQGAAPASTPTLTIDAGVEIRGATGAAIFITRGAKIEANGSPSAPIIMSSEDANFSNDSDKEEGEWGGLVIQGFGITNKCGATDGGTGCDVSGEGNSGFYGGFDNADSSGSLQYVIVTEAGAQTGADGNELNGIGFMAVGSGTTVNFVQVNENFDDGVEFWGGAVAPTNLVLTNNGDDSIDWDNGWVGSINNVLVVHDSLKADSAVEADTDGSNFNKDPISKPTISNFTFVAGGDSDRGIRLKEGTGAVFQNGTIYGFESSSKAKCLDIESKGAGDSVDKIGTDVTFSGVTQTCVGNLDFVDSTGTTVTVTGVTENSGLATPSVPSFATGWVLTGTTTFDASIEVCPDFSTAGSNAGECVLPTTVTEDISLSAKYTWLLDATMVVGDGNVELQGTAPASNPTLTIGAGVEIKGAAGAAIFITRGAKIEANGTSSAPIIMSSQDDNFSNDSDKEEGEWGGLVIQGFGITNKCGATDGGTGCDVSGEGNSGFYGGFDNTDSSGTLEYVVITEAGAQTGADGNELNGIGFMAVGSGTTVNFVQVNENFDDGVEFWGGAVAPTNLVLTNNGDDSIDWDNGWVGSINNVFVVHDSLKADSAVEADTDGSNFNKDPISKPTISNFIFIAGGDSDRGIRLKEGTGAVFQNGTIYGFESSSKAKCLDIESNGSGDSVDKIGTDVTFSGVTQTCVGNLDFVDSTGTTVTVTGVTEDASAVKPATPAYATGWTVGTF